MRSLLQWLRSRFVAVATLHYVLVQLLYRLGLRKHLSGATHQRYTRDGSVEYVRRVFHDYLTYGGLTPNDLAGTRILEVGPGDNLGVALLFVAHGAEKVVCLDRFESQRDESRNREVYQALLGTLEGEPRQRTAACLDAGGGICSPRVDHRCGVAIEEAGRIFPPGSFDLIVSRAVLEHVYDVEAAWRSMDRLLADDGRMLHKIDFRHHSFYEDYHPLRFLTVPRWLWGLVSSPDPTLNRARRPQYVRLAEAFGYRHRTLVTHLALRQEELVPHRERLVPGVDYDAADVASVEALRPRLVRPFRDMTAEDLLVSGIFLWTRKNGAAYVQSK